MDKENKEIKDKITEGQVKDGSIADNNDNEEKGYDEVELDEEKPKVEDGNSYIIAAFCHLSFFIGLGILGPIVIYLVSEDYYVKDHAKEAMGSQIMFTIGYFLAGILSMILIGLIFIPVLLIAQVIWSVKGAKAALHGEYYNYPISSKYVQNI